MASVEHPGQTGSSDERQPGGFLSRCFARYRDLLADPAPRRLLFAAMASYIGDRFNTIALIALSYEMGDGAFGVGGMLAVIMLPRLILQGPAGMLVDRHSGRRLLIGTQLVLAMIAACFALLTLLPSLWLLYGLAFLMASGRTIEMPAFEVRLMSAVKPSQRGVANAAHMLAITIGDLAGPLIGALVLSLVGVVPLFLLNALTFLLLARAIARSNTAYDEPALTAEEVVVIEPNHGYRWLLRRSDVVLYTMLTVAASALILGTIALFAERSRELGLGEGGVGLFYAAMGVGTLIGGLVAGAGTYAGRHALAIAGGAAGIGVIAQVGYGAIDVALVALIAVALFGMMGDIEEIAALTYFQLGLPASSYGRFFSLFLMANGVGGVAGALVAPMLANHFNSGIALTLLAMPAFLAAAAIALHSLAQSFREQWIQRVRLSSSGR